jgi:hypothetical protein
MTGTHESQRETLPFRVAAALCRRLLSIGERIYDYAQELEDAGFSAFCPYRRFLEQFGETEADREIHHACQIEFVKTQLSRPWPMWLTGPPDGGGLTYTSDLFARLCRERDEANGVSIEQVAARFPTEGWRREIDPCRRKMIQAELTDRSTFQRLRQSVDEEIQDRLTLEAKLWATDVARSFGFGKRGRYRLYTMMMERDAGALGFGYDKLKSRPNFPVFSKPVLQQWHICWAMEESRSFLLSSLEGQFTPHLQIRHRSLYGSVDRADPHRFLIIRY